MIKGCCLAPDRADTSTKRPRDGERQRERERETCPHCGEGEASLSSAELRECPRSSGVPGADRIKSCAAGDRAILFDLSGSVKDCGLARALE